MKTTILFFGLSIGILLTSCGGGNNESTGTTTETTPKESTLPKAEGKAISIKGNIKGLPAGTNIIFEKRTPNASETLGSAVSDANGSFEIKSATPQVDIFRVIVGGAFIWLALEGGENITINAVMENNALKSCEIQGSAASQEMMSKLMADIKGEELVKYLNEHKEDQPLVNFFLIGRVDINGNIAIYERVAAQIVKAYPNWVVATEFKKNIDDYKVKMSNMPVAIGNPVPEIRMKDPNGKELTLSSLKGKVVLLDFWASWCGPCRRENPNVVAVYDKYNKQGFEVFSVSLDGLDDQTIARLQNNPTMLNQQMEGQKQRWIQAIKDDKLKWPWHVSELRSWSSSVAQQFGVNSIPRAFLIDKNGVIRYANLRGPELEVRVKELLGVK